jgi:hypothetical protein
MGGGGTGAKAKEEIQDRTVSEVLGKQNERRWRIVNENIVPEDSEGALQRERVNLIIFNNKSIEGVVQGNASRMVTGTLRALITKMNWSLPILSRSRARPSIMNEGRCVVAGRDIKKA